MCFFFQAEDGIRDYKVTGVQTCALPIFAYRALWSSEKYLSLALSALPSVPAEKVKAVREAFLQMAEAPEGAKVLESSAAVLKQASPLRFIAAKDAEFENMRRFYRTALVKVELQ